MSICLQVDEISFVKDSKVLWRDRYRPSAVLEGVLIWKASFLMKPSPIRQEFPWIGFLLRIRVAAASPKLSPIRSMSNGRQGSGESAFKDWKPDRMNCRGVSQPHTMAASYRPESISLLPKIKADSPEIQALQTTIGLESIPNWLAILCAESAKEIFSSIFPFVELRIKAVCFPFSSSCAFPMVFCSFPISFCAFSIFFCALAIAFCADLRAKVSKSSNSREA